MEVRAGRSTSLRYRLIAALGACAFWGIWAYFMNITAGSVTALSAAVSQGICSLVFTLVVIHSVTVLHNFFLSSRFRLIIPAIAVVGVLGLFLASVHLLNGTPNIVYTVVPPLCLAFIFCIYTGRALTLDKA